MCQCESYSTPHITFPILSGIPLGIIAVFDMVTLLFQMIAFFMGHQNRIGSEIIAVAVAN